jgi:protein O-GlcNAc transferase
MGVHSWYSQTGYPTEIDWPMSEHANRFPGNYRMLICCCVGVLVASTVLGQDSQSRIEQHARSAQQAQREGDFATAVREFTILSRVLPEVAEVHSNLGVAYYFHKQPQQALLAFDKALQLKPDLVSALIFSGILNNQFSKSAEAAKLLERAIELNPLDPLAQTWLAHSYAAEGRYREAADHFLLASERSPTDVDIWYGLGQVYLELGRQEVERLANLAPAGARILQLAGDLWLLRGDSDKALTLYQQALKRRPGLTEVQQIVSRLSQGGKAQPLEVSQIPPPASESSVQEDKHYLAATDYRERAQRAFERISALGANSHRAHQILAESLRAQERVNEALAEYRAASRLKPDIVGIHRDIGDLLMGDGKVTEAVEEYRTELLLRPNDSQVYYRLGRALIVLGNEKDAEVALTRSLALGHHPPAVHKELGKIYLNRGQPAKAVQSLSKYLETTAGDGLSHYLLMRAYRALGDSAKSEHHLAKFKSLSADEKERASAQQAMTLFSGRKQSEQ